ncbi:MAG: restriction endonuclease subunit S [Flavobacterium sp.]|nr:restriction endonuclease subunit S [Flavobacterium sp.]
MNESKKIPEDWKWVKLEELCDKISLNKIKLKQKDYLENGTYPVVDQGQELIGGYFNDRKLLIPEEPPFIVFGDHTKVKKYITFKFIPGADGVKVLKPKMVVLSKFLYYSLFTIKIEDKGYARHFQLLEKELFPLPPKKIQLAIVSKIEELFSELDKGIEILCTAQQQLKTYRQAVLKWAFEGRFTNENMKDGELPGGWKRIELSHVCEIKRGKSKHRPRNEPMLYGGIYPFIQTGDIRNSSGRFINSYTQTYSELGLKQSKLWPKGTLCITIAANIGETAILGFNACFPDSVVGLLSNEKVLLTQYTNYYFISFKQKLEELAPATAQKNINVDILEKVLIPLAPIHEQYKIIEAIENRLSVADKMEESIIQSLQQSEALKQSILKKAFEGKL